MALNMIHMLRTQKCTPAVPSIILVYPTTSNSLHEDIYETTCGIVCHLLYNTATEREFSNTCFKVKTVTLIRTVHYSWLHYREAILQRRLLQALQLSLTLINTRHFAN